MDEITPNMAPLLPEEPKKRNTLVYVLLPILVTILAISFWLIIRQGRPLEKIVDPKINQEKDNYTEQMTELNVSSEDLKRKNDLISSRNIDEVMTAISLGHIPEEYFDNRSFSRVNVKSFKVVLDVNERYNKLTDYLNVTEFPVENSELNNNEWKGFGYTEASNMYTKKGYACIIMQPNRFGTQPYISCANILNLSNNNVQDVSQFILKTLSEADIDCGFEKCEVTETIEDFPLTAYGREYVYFDKNIVRDNDTKLINLIKQEAQEAADFIRSSGWEADLEDYTNTEKGWSKDVLVSMKISAENYWFNCTHTITLRATDKRQIVSCSYKDAVLEEVQKFYNPYE